MTEMRGQAVAQPMLRATHLERVEFPAIVPGCVRLMLVLVIRGASNSGNDRCSVSCWTGLKVRGGFWQRNVTFCVWKVSRQRALYSLSVLKQGEIMNHELENEYKALLKKHGLQMPSPIETYGDTLRHLESERGSLRSVHDLLHSMPEFSARKYSNTVPETEFDDAYRIIKAAFEMDFGKMREDLYVNTFPTGEFNAWSIKTPSGYLCLLDEGLLGLILNVAVPLLHPLSDAVSNYSAVSSWGDGVGLGDLNYPNLRNKQNREKTRVTLTKLMHVILQFIEGVNARQIKQLYPEDGNRSSLGYNMAVALQLSVKMFVIAHEISHIRVGHFDYATIQAAKTSQGKLSVLNVDHAKEYEADRGANYVLTKTFDKDRPFFVPYAIGGPCFFIIDMIVNIVKSKLNRKQYDVNTCSDSHPGSFDRMNRMAMDARNVIGKSLDNYLLLCKIMADVLTIVYNAEIVVKDGKINFTMPNGIFV
jgi:hypothetical protein